MKTRPLPSSRLTPLVAFAFALAACATHEVAPRPAPPVSASPAASSASPTVSVGNDATTRTSDTAAPVPPATHEPTTLAARPVSLPGATAPLTLDYIASQRATPDTHERVWVPVGDTGSVDVLDVTDGTFARVNGFQTQAREVRGKTRVMGPSAVALGEGVAYVGNRSTGEVCVIGAKSLKRGMCLKLTSPPDGLAYVASAKEVWVTTPKDDSLTVLDASKPERLQTKLLIKLEGAPEGYAVDDSRGLFFTNLEDKNRTVVIDAKTHKASATWNPECGPDGPRGIATDTSTGLVFVACTDHVQILDGAHQGTALGRIDTGAGVDNIDWSDAHRLLYVAAGKAATLTLARVDEKGRATTVARGATAEGARNGVADAEGNAYVADPVHAQLLVFAFSP